jgi:hypothetical protein
MSRHTHKKEDWMNSKWRPAMGWMYMLVCTCDFVIFPILWSLLQAFSHGQVTSQWQPLTLQGAGLFHLAMGGVLGVAAFGRTQEKISGTNYVAPPAPPTPNNQPIINNQTPTTVVGRKSPVPESSQPML